jgi:DNA-binding winged helix-turn-helix (wHTH) protein
VVHALGDGLELDTLLFELRRDGQQVPMEPQAFDVLVYLVSHRDRVVPKEELMDAIWGGRFVSETAVTSRIKQVRKALGDDGQAQRLIRTLHGRGYHFVGPVGAEDSAAGGQRDAPSGASEPVRYTVSDDLHVAYQVTGGGDLDIVLISGFASHLELDWADPRHAHFLDRLGSMGRLIRFDKRGTGMSDRPSGLPDLETRMHDVLAVMDAVGSRRAVLCGYSEGGAMAILMAATHPERTSALVLYGCYAKATWAPDYAWARTQEARRAYTEMLLTSWDWEADFRRRCPSADAAMQRWWAQRMRAAATPSTIRALLDMNSLVDVRDALGAVRVPALVLHRIGDAMFQVADARYIADHIPGA